MTIRSKDNISQISPIGNKKNPQCATIAGFGTEWAAFLWCCTSTPPAQSVGATPPKNNIALFHRPANSLGLLPGFTVEQRLAGGGAATQAQHNLATLVDELS